MQHWKNTGCYIASAEDRAQVKQVSQAVALTEAPMQVATSSEAQPSPIGGQPAEADAAADNQAAVPLVNDSLHGRGLDFAGAPDATSAPSPAQAASPAASLAAAAAPEASPEANGAPTEALVNLGAVSPAAEAAGDAVDAAEASAPPA